MTVKAIGKNQTEIELDNGLTVLYSYSTPVAIFYPGKGGLVTSTKYSVTTSKHITQAINRWGCSRNEVSQEEINRYAKGETK